MNYSMQAFGAYKETEKASAMKMRDYKDATDLVVGGGDRLYGYCGSQGNDIGVREVAGIS